MIVDRRFDIVRAVRKLTGQIDVVAHALPLGTIALDYILGRQMLSNFANNVCMGF